MSVSALSPGPGVACEMESGSERRSPHHSMASLASIFRMRSRTETMPSFRQPLRITRNWSSLQRPTKSLRMVPLSSVRAMTRSSEDAASGLQLARN